MSLVEKAQQKLKLQGGTLSAIDVGIKSVRKFGTIQLTGVYGSLYNMFPLGNIFERNVTVKMGQIPAIHYSQMLYDMVAEGKIDPTKLLPIKCHYLKQVMHTRNSTIMKIKVLILS